MCMNQFIPKHLDISGLEPIKDPKVLEDYNPYQDNYLISKLRGVRREWKTK